MTTRPYPLNWGSRTFVMGILNVTPDSFSGDGLITQGSAQDAAVLQARSFASAGADILDIGGESTRPGAETVSEAEEMERILPVIHAIRKENPDIILSVDTYKANVAREAVATGADWINDVWALRRDPNMASAAAKLGVPVILMHNRSGAANVQLHENLGGRYVGVDYADLMGDILQEILESVSTALDAGIARENILVDPGIGFGKTVSQNLEILNRLDEVRSLGYPVMLGVSRKSFIGYTLNLPANERLEGTAAAVSIGIARGADIVRVHDVPFMVRIARMADAITRR